jgi:hypothetical protein
MSSATTATGGGEVTNVSDRAPAPMPLTPGMPFEDPFGVLRRVMQPRERAAPGERCEMCSEDITARHSHVANIAEHRLLCTCRGCYLLFTVPGAGGLRMRAVPEDYRLASDFAFTQAQWDSLAVPVDLAFVFKQSDADAAQPLHLVACYPSPAGATESELDLSMWDDIVASSKSLSDIEPDVQAVLLRRTPELGFVCFVVPVDACYELVGVVRQHWVGFQGGAEVWAHIDEFFNDLYRRARLEPPTQR